MVGIVAILAVIGAVSGLNLLLMVGVARRLRDHEQRLSVAESSVGAASVTSGPPPGAPAPPIQAACTDGRTVETNWVHSPEALIGFFSSDCEACYVHAPEFTALSARYPAGFALSVIADDANGAAPLLQMLEGSSLVVVEPHRGPIGNAYHVEAYPTFVALRNGVATAVSSTLRQLPQPSATTTSG